ncbi:MAG: GYD domain-containing protein [Thermoplasmatales archaeon]|nr:MAG: GYD domain-containing protein [Thermoplasmatales archaeon]
MFFITLTKWKQKPSKKMQATIDQATKTFEDLKKQGIKMRIYWTIGRYDAVTIMEAPTEKDAMKILLPFQEIVDTETMIAVPREEAIKLI